MSTRPGWSATRTRGRAGWRAVMTLVAAAAACGGDGGGGPAAAGPRVDTLPSGVVRVSNPDGAAAEPRFRLVEELGIGGLDAEGPEAFGEVLALAVDAAGRVHVLDGHAREVRVFGPDGRHLRSLGAPGRGPGELAGPIGLAFDAGGRLWVIDPGNGRYMLFGPDGELVGERPRPLGGFVMPWAGGFDRSGRLWEGVNRYVPGQPELLALVAVDAASGATGDSLVAGPAQEGFFEVRSGGASERVHVPFTPWLVWRFDPRGYLWTADATAYRIHQRTLAGDTVRVIDKAYQAVPVSRAELDSALVGLEGFRRMGGVVDPGRIPDRKPAFGALFVDASGRLWLPLHTEGDAVGPSGSTLFDVLDPEGRWLGTARSDVPLELHLPAPVFGDGVVHAVAADELGVPRVVRLRISTRSSTPSPDRPGSPGGPGASSP